MRKFPAVVINSLITLTVIFGLVGCSGGKEETEKPSITDSDILNFVCSHDDNGQRVSRHSVDMKNKTWEREKKGPFGIINHVFDDVTVSASNISVTGQFMDRDTFYVETNVISRVDLSFAYSTKFGGYEMAFNGKCEVAAASTAERAF
jgi:hypothetical protein